MADIEFHASIRQEDGMLWAEVGELPGCFASGENLEELYEALVEAIEMCLSPDDVERLSREERPVPSSIGIAYAVPAAGVASRCRAGVDPRPASSAATRPACPVPNHPGPPTAA